MNQTSNIDFIAQMKSAAVEMQAHGGVVRTDGKESKQGISAYSHGRAGDTMRMNPYLIQEEEGFNSRDWDDVENHAHVDWLAQDIAQRGLRKPLEVRWDKATKTIFLTDGHCRLRAVKRAIEVYDAKIEMVTVTTSNVPEDLYDRTIKTISDNTGKRNSILESVRQIRKLIQISGKSVDEVARDLTKEAQIVRLWLEMDSAISPEIRKLITSGAVALNTAYQAIKDNDFDTEKALENILKGQELAAEGKEGEKAKVMPRHIKEARGAAAGSLKKELKAMIQGKDRKIQVSHKQDGQVALTMDAETYAKIAEMLGLKNDGQKPILHDSRQLDLLLAA
jgi:hypothetical protein